MELPLITPSDRASDRVFLLISRQLGRLHEGSDGAVQARDDPLHRRHHAQRGRGGDPRGGWLLARRHNSWGSLAS